MPCGASSAIPNLSTAASNFAIRARRSETVGENEQASASWPAPAGSGTRAARTAAAALAHGEKLQESSVCRAVAPHSRGTRYGCAYDDPAPRAAKYCSTTQQYFFAALHSELARHIEQPATSTKTPMLWFAASCSCLPPRFVHQPQRGSVRWRACLTPAFRGRRPV